jgi:hypothetical protein
VVVCGLAGDQEMARRSDRRSKSSTPGLHRRSMSRPIYKYDDTLIFDKQ